MDQENRKQGNLNLTDDDDEDLNSRHFADWLEKKVHFSVFMYSELYWHLNLTNCTYRFYKVMDQLLQKR